MGIEIKTTMDMREIRDYLNREAQRHLARTIEMLQNVGERVVNEIRTSHISDWNDQWGNLRSSVGYIIAMDGKPIAMSDFSKVLGPLLRDDANAVRNKSEGSQAGRQYARELVSLYPQGIALIVVAGMEYASYVENRDNKVVLAQGEIEAKTLIEQMIQKLNAKLGNKE